MTRSDHWLTTRPMFFWSATRSPIPAPSTMSRQNGCPKFELAPARACRSFCAACRLTRATIQRSSVSCRSAGARRSILSRRWPSAARLALPTTWKRARSTLTSTCAKRLRSARWQLSSYGHAGQLAACWAGDQLASARTAAQAQLKKGQFLTSLAQPLRRRAMGVAAFG